MKVLVACEFSGIVRDAFIRAGHDAISCDLLPSESSYGPHYQGDIDDILYSEEWDLLVAHPPCTRLANSGVKHLYIDQSMSNPIDPVMWKEMELAAAFYRKFLTAKAKKKAIENPIMHKHARLLVGGKATQYIQPWHHGQKKNKATGFRLINLPKLEKTNVVGPMPKTVLKGTPEYRSWNEVWYESPGPDRWKNRSRTYHGIAEAMATQWG